MKGGTKTLIALLVGSIFVVVFWYSYLMLLLLLVLQGGHLPFALNSRS